MATNENKNKRIIGPKFILKPIKPEESSQTNNTNKILIGIKKIKNFNNLRCFWRSLKSIKTENNNEKPTKILSKNKEVL